MFLFCFPLAAFSSCAPPAPPAPAEPGSFEEAAALLRIGDLARLRAALGKDEAAPKRGAELAKVLDPEAWLLVMGASQREHDPAALLRAMDSGDAEAFRDALGFSDQALQMDILEGGSSLRARRAGGKVFYDSGRPPAALLAQISPLPCDNRFLHAWRLEYVSEREGHLARLRLAHDGRTPVEFRPAAEIFEVDFVAPAGAARAVSPRQAVENACAGLGAPWSALARGAVLTDEDAEGARGLTLAGVSLAGDLLTLALGRDEKGWYLVDSRRTTQQERLERLQDEALERIAVGASDWRAATKRWPKRREDLKVHVGTSDWVDPAASSGLRGWGRYGRTPEPGIELVVSEDEGDDVLLARTVETDAHGRRRGITRGGELRWIEP